VRVCLDTNVVVQIFGVAAPCAAIRQALLSGRLELALSNEITLEYEEVITRLSGAARWQQLASLFDVLDRLHGNIVRVEPAYRFRVIALDPDDNKFVDCAIAAAADYILTEDRHFAALAGAGYRPQPITPQAFMHDHLGFASP
jgi:putative PIN family toxin of toxin-antitoxin system